MWALCAAMAAASAVFLLLGPARPAPDDVFGGVGGASFVVLSLTLATVGALVAARTPANRIGWVFCATGLLYGENDEQREAALQAAEPLALPWISAALDRFGKILADLAP